MFGCFVGGWAADSIGRVNGIFYSAIVALVGGSLQAAAQNSDFMIVARVITGVGTGGKSQVSEARLQPLRAMLTL